MKIVVIVTKSMQINNLFMPILFNFIVFSNTQNFLYFPEHGGGWS